MICKRRKWRGTLSILGFYYPMLNTGLLTLKSVLGWKYSVVSVWCEESCFVNNRQNCFMVNTDKSCFFRRHKVLNIDSITTLSLSYET